MRRAEDWKSLSTPRWAMSGEGRPVREQPPACRPPAAESVSVRTGHPLPTRSIPQAPDFSPNRDARPCAPHHHGEAPGPARPRRLRHREAPCAGGRAARAHSSLRQTRTGSAGASAREGRRAAANSTVTGVRSPRARRARPPLAAPSSRAPAPAGQRHGPLGGLKSALR